MPTTSNFGWTTPADTDLVKDGALAIRTLGNGIDTSMAQLKGGTTGQVLSKTSNTDMAFTWVTQDDANAIQNAIVDAKGDLIAATANDTPARLAVGNNGETLVADSSTSTGLRYTAGNPIPNPVLNSAFQIWQRGTSFAISAPAYTADRWQAGRGANTSGTTISRQVTSDTTNLPNIQYCARIQRDNGNTTTNPSYFVQSLESVNSIPLAGRTITYSFYARRGANYSGTSNGLTIIVAQGTGTDQNLLTNGYTGGTNIISQIVTLTTTWQRFTITASVPSTTTELGLMFQFDPTGTAGANDFYEITGVQIDVGSVALSFRTNGATLAGELAACQRYYYRQNWQALSNYAVFGIGFANTTGACYIETTFPVNMRVKPTAVDTAAMSAYAFEVGTTYFNTPTTIAIDSNYSSPNNGTLAITKAGSFAVGTYYRMGANNNSGAYIGWSAEL